MSIPIASYFLFGYWSSAFGWFASTAPNATIEALPKILRGFDEQRQMEEVLKRIGRRAEELGEQEGHR
jgi:hypothetical protein